MDKLLKYTFLLGLSIILLASCKKKEDDPEPEDNSVTLPTNVTIDIPESLSSATLQSLDRKYHDIRIGEKAACTTKLDGNDLYKHLRVFIHVGERSAEVIQEIMTAIAQHNLTTAQTVTFTSDDDGREKTLVVEENASLDGIDYSYKLTVTDEDSSKALQVFWNSDNGVAILSPNDINRNNTENPNALYRVDFASNTTSYEKEMTVSISGLELTEKYSTDNLKMFVGKNGDILDIYGNTNHPDIYFLDSTFTGGRNWAFVAHGDVLNDVAVAEVSLPPSGTTSNASILTDYSIYKVLESELNSVGITDSATVACVLEEAVSPGYFEKGTGYVSSGSNVPSNSAFTTSFIDLSGMLPYNPIDVRDLSLSFQ